MNRKSVIDSKLHHQKAGGRELANSAFGVGGTQ
jgi:hypothetical protein